jgi:septal ring factor EnvC (AmiA/AmiB activator)
MDLNQKIAELKSSIDKLSNDIFNNIQQRIIENLETMLSVRQRMLDELLTLPEQATQASELRDYLSAIREKDQSMIQILKNEANQIKVSLHNIEKTKEYLVE